MIYFVPRSMCLSQNVSLVISIRQKAECRPDKSYLEYTSCKES